MGEQKPPVKQPLPCCGYVPKGTDDHAHPVMWNPWNQVVQCHNCGQVWVQAGCWPDGLFGGPTVNDEQIYTISVLLVAASGRKTPLTMGAAEEMLREIVSLPRGPFVQPEPVAAETDAPLPTKEAPDVYCPCEPHPYGVAIPLEGEPK